VVGFSLRASSSGAWSTALLGKGGRFERAGRLGRGIKDVWEGRATLCHDGRSVGVLGGGGRRSGGRWRKREEGGGWVGWFEAGLGRGGGLDHVESGVDRALDLEALSGRARTGRVVCTEGAVAISEVSVLGVSPCAENLCALEPAVLAGEHLGGNVMFVWAIWMGATLEKEGDDVLIAVGSGEMKRSGTRGADDGGRGIAPGVRVLPGQPGRDDGGAGWSRDGEEGGGEGRNAPGSIDIGTMLDEEPDDLLVAAGAGSMEGEDTVEDGVDGLATGEGVLDEADVSSGGGGVEADVLDCGKWVRTMRTTSRTTDSRSRH
jgi:hypothetical protein